METKEGETNSDPVGYFDPNIEVKEEMSALRETRKSLGGESLRPIEIDMDILADAYPREGSFLVSSNENAPVNMIDLKSPRTPHSKVRIEGTPGGTSSKKTPNRRFFKSEHEREYARNLMKELVQIYILQGQHGKEAFRKALNETRRRIHVRRGETAPSPPPILSPVQESPYPKLSPPLVQPAEMTVAGNTSEAPIQIGRGLSPLRRNAPVAPSTPSRVKLMAAALQLSSTPVDAGKAATPHKRTPGSTRVRVVAEAIEAQILSATPGRDKPTKTPGKIQEGEPSIPRTSARKKKSVDSVVEEATTPPSKRKNEAIVEQTSSRRSNRKRESAQRVVSPVTEVKRSRRAAVSEQPQTENRIPKSMAKRKQSDDIEASEKKKVASKKDVSPSSKHKKTKVKLVTIPEDEAVVVSARPSRKAKNLANEGLIKK